MSEQDGTESSTKQRRIRKTNTPNQENSKQILSTQRPAFDDTEAWQAYWTAQGQHWRTEPEIDKDRQRYLTERRSITPDLTQGIYPFKDIKLSRADVEWLLATHENGRGPIDWTDPNQRRRKGLDLRGAVLVGVDLHALPLARLKGGIIGREQINIMPELRAITAVHLEGANLNEAHLEGATLSRARLEGAKLWRVHLEEARLHFAHMEGANLREAHLEGAFLYKANLNGKDLKEEELKRLQQLKPDFPSKLEPANLQFAFFDRATNLDSVMLGEKKHGFVTIAFVRWGDVNLELVNWQGVEMSGEEYIAHQKQTLDGKKKDRGMKRLEYRKASRANRQLSNALRSQGLNEEAAYFAYHAQMLQREVWRLQHNYLKYIGSWLLFLLAGYGYRPGRSVFWYLFMIFEFAFAYFVFGHLAFFPDAFVFSLTSFHGRGFFPGLGNENSLHNPLVIMAAFEAVVGLLIEISFIATFTQRFFGR